jgi:hypothetical protein
MVCLTMNRIELHHSQTFHSERRFIQHGIHVCYPHTQRERRAQS